MTSDKAQRYGWENGGATYSASYLVSPVKEIISRHRAARVVDVGAGNGANLPHWAERASAVVGIEPDREGFEIAKEASPSIPVYNLGVYDDPSSISEQSFDVAISLEVVEHLFDPHALPRFVRKIVRPGGLFVISTPYHGYLKNLALSLTGKWDFHHHPLRVGGHIKFWSRNSLQKLLFENGFTPLQFCGCGRLPYLWKSMLIVASRDAE